MSQSYTVHIETPIGTKSFGMNFRGDAAAAKTEIERQQKIVSEKTGAPLLPHGEVSVHDHDPGDPLGTLAAMRGKGLMSDHPAAEELPPLPAEFTNFEDSD